MRRLIAISGLLIFAGLACGGTLDAASAQTNAPDAAGTSPTAAARKAAKKPAPQATGSDVIPDAPAPSGDTGAPGQGSVPQAGDAIPDDPGGHQAAPPAQTPPAPSPATPGKKRTAAEENPFPEEDSKQAAHDAAGDADGSVDRLTDSSPAGSSPAGSSSSGSGSGSRAPGSGPSPDAASIPPPDAAGSSSQQGLDKLDLYGEKDKKSAGHRRNGDPDAGLAYDPKLAAEDDKIADLYMKHGNAPGAYSRYKDAEAHDSGDANAVFGVAESARQMKLFDEASQAYQTYLFAFPDGPKARVAKKALAELKVQAKR